MPVQNVECQLAKAQISRYITGEAISPEAVAQLEEHIAECPRCKKLLAARRKSLMAKLDSASAPVATLDQGDEPATRALAEAPAHAPVNAVIADEGKPSVAEALRMAATEQVQRVKAMHQHAAEKRPAAPVAVAAASWKPIAYSVGLAAVLIAMSAFAKNPTNLFGARASEAIPAATPLEPVTPPASLEGALLATVPDVPAPAEAAVDPAPETPPAAAETEPVETIASPEPTVVPPPAAPQQSAPVTRRASTSRRPANRPAASAPARTSGGGSIQVYDADGNPIKPN
jgi:hypothetical protein